MTQRALTEDSTSRFAQTKTLRLHYQEAGEGHPIVFLHGGGPGATGWSNFSPSIGPLSERFRVVALDMPGWGKSELPKPGQGDLPDAVLQLLDELRIERAALVGNSLGGATSIRFGIQNPTRISHLIVMGAPCPGPNLFSSGLISEGVQVLFDTYRDPSPANFKRLVQVMCFDQKFATDELAKQRSETALARPEQLANFLQRGTSMPPDFLAQPARVAEIKAPTLGIYGRNDRTVHYEHGLRLVSLIQNSRLVLLNRCGHWAQLEHAAEFNRLVSDFVANNG